MSINWRAVVGATALLCAIFRVNSAIQQSIATLGLRWSYPGWLSASPWVFLSTLLSGVLLLGLLLLAKRPPGRAMLVGTLIAYLANIALSFLFLGTRMGAFMVLGNWVGIIGAVLLGFGLLRSELVEPWIAWFGEAVGVGLAIRMLVPKTLFIGAIRVGAVLGLAYWAVVLVFSFGLAASLLTRPDRGPGDAEQALQPDASSVGY